MIKKAVSTTLALIFVLALASSAFCGGGPKFNDNYGPIVILGDPWDEYKRSTSEPPCLRPGPTAGSGGLFHAPAYTNFVVEFYLRYVIKQENDGRSISWRNGRSE
jgi:hypothetical protein